MEICRDMTMHLEVKIKVKVSPKITAQVKVKGKIKAEVKVKDQVRYSWIGIIDHCVMLLQHQGILVSVISPMSHLGLCNWFRSVRFDENCHIGAHTEIHKLYKAPLTHSIAIFTCLTPEIHPVLLFTPKRLSYSPIQIWRGLGAGLMMY